MTAKQDSENLMNTLLPLARKMLRDYGEFCPYGGYMKPDGEIVDMGYKDPNTDRPKSTTSISVLRETFQEKARVGQCKAVAVIFDVIIPLPQSDRKSDAIQVCVDHVDGYSAEVFFPYQIANGKVIYGQTFAQEGGHMVFGVN